MCLSNKTVLVTGGIGSFGEKFIEVALKEYNPKVIRVFSRDELKQYEMSQRFKEDEGLRFFIGDVRDSNRLSRGMNGVDVVVHAAALKQVPACEYNPIEAIKTNIDGAINTIEAAIDNSVEKVIALSTDKAVQPVNLYGATKLVAEKLFVQGNAYTGENPTQFSCVRYGNVVGSRGSVIPLFQKQRQEGLITLTDKRMTRFWITLNQGVRFVIACLGRMKGGEVFCPKIPSMKLTDLAETIAPNCKQQFIGIRPGEKIHEVLLTAEEACHTKEFNDYYIVEPEHSFWSRNAHLGGQRLPDDFEYTSDGNKHWLTQEELRQIVEVLS